MEYILNSKLSLNQLQGYGFSKYFILRKSVYKKNIFLKMYIENNEDGKPEFNYIVWDSAHEELYYPYYYHEFGRDSVLETVQKNVKKELKRLVREGILVEVNNEKDC